MATRSYARPVDAPIDPVQLAQALNVALSRTGTLCQITSTTIEVSHPALVAGDDVIITASLLGYLYDPAFGRLPEAAALQNVIATLRQWSTDAAGEVAVWDVQTQAQKNVALKLVVARLGTLCDRLADVLAVTGQGT